MSLPNIFFIRGGMKFGTTWLQRIVDQHPEILCSGEYHFEMLDHGLRNLETTPNAVFNTLGQFEAFRQDYEHLITTHLRLSILALRGASRRDLSNVKLVGDRTPVPMLPLTVRGVPYIVILRDGRDVVVSAAYHALNRLVTLGAEPEPFGPVSVIEKYREDPAHFVERPEELLVDEPFVRQLASDWHRATIRNLQGLEMKRENRLPAPVRFIRYEDLHSDTESVRKDLLTFLGVDPELAPPLSNVTRPGAKEEDPTQFVRKGVVGDHVRYFTPRVQAWFEDEVGETMKSAGYS